LGNYLVLSSKIVLLLCLLDSTLFIWWFFKRTGLAYALIVFLLSILLSLLTFDRRNCRYRMRPRAR
jgi:hypothetical protein